MYNFEHLYETKNKLKECLEKYFGLVYIEQKEKKVIKDDKNNLSSNLDLFKIPKQKASIFEKITSIDKLNEVKKEIKEKYDNFSDDFIDYFDRVESQLNEHQIKSFEIIEKIIKSRDKKLKNSLTKFKIEDSWNVEKIKEEFFFQVQKNLNDIIENLIPTFIVGMKESTAYEGLIKIFNRFLSNLGIYTLEIKINKKFDDYSDDMISPQECEDCETTDKTKKDMIKEVISYPYLVDEDKVISESKVILWRIVYNG